MTSQALLFNITYFACLFTCYDLLLKHGGVNDGCKL